MNALDARLSLLTATVGTATPARTITKTTTTIIITKG